MLATRPLPSGDEIRRGKGKGKGKGKVVGGKEKLGRRMLSLGLDVQQLLVAMVGVAAVAACFARWLRPAAGTRPIPVLAFGGVAVLVVQALVAVGIICNC